MNPKIQAVEAKQLMNLVSNSIREQLSLDRIISGAIGYHHAANALATKQALQRVDSLKQIGF